MAVSFLVQQQPVRLLRSVTRNSVLLRPCSVLSVTALDEAGVWPRRLARGLSVGIHVKFRRVPLSPSICLQHQSRAQTVYTWAGCVLAHRCRQLYIWCLSSSCFGEESMLVSLIIPPGAKPVGVDSFQKFWSRSIYKLSGHSVDGRCFRVVSFSWTLYHVSPLFSDRRETWYCIQTNKKRIQLWVIFWLKGQFCVAYWPMRYLCLAFCPLVQL